MKNIILISFLIIGFFSQSQNISIVSWNIRDMGKTKDSSEIAFMANTVKDYDIIAIQEVVTSEYGIKTVSMFAKELNREKGCKCWKFDISEKTTGKGTEKYVFLYDSRKVSLINTYLFNRLDSQIVREPFIGTFLVGSHIFSIVNFHAVPENKNPETEITKLVVIDEIVKNPVIFLGDFNHEQYRRGFDAIKKMSYAPSLIGEKTTIMIKVKNGNHLSREFDNFFYDITYFNVLNSYVLDFTGKFNNLKHARNISDHCPIIIELNFKDE